MAKKLKKVVKERYRFSAELDRNKKLVITLFRCVGEKIVRTQNVTISRGEVASWRKKFSKAHTYSEYIELRTIVRKLASSLEVDSKAKRAGKCTNTCLDSLTRIVSVHSGNGNLMDEIRASKKKK